MKEGELDFVRLPVMLEPNIKYGLVCEHVQRTSQSSPHHEGKKLEGAHHDLVLGVGLEMVLKGVSSNVSSRKKPARSHDECTSESKMEGKGSTPFS